MARTCEDCGKPLQDGEEGSVCINCLTDGG